MKSLKFSRLWMPVSTIALLWISMSSIAEAAGLPKSCPLQGCGMRLLCCVVWGLLASAFLCLSWNKVIAYLAKVKKIKYWQALLVVMTLCAFCAPRYYWKSKCQHSCCEDGGKGCPHGKYESHGPEEGAGDSK